MVVPVLPLSMSVHSNQFDTVDQVCTAALGCAQSDLVEQALLLVVTGIVAVFILAAIQHVSAARARVAEERSRTATERHAFSQFARHIARVEPSMPSVKSAPADGMVSATTVVGPPQPDQGLERVRSAYEQSVMSMSHYPEEYDEPLAHHMAQEFGDAVATAVADGGQLTPQLKQALLHRAQDAARDRERLMTRLDRESEALDDARSQLSTVAGSIDEAESRTLHDRSFRNLTDEWNLLGELESRLTRLLARRQESLNDNDVTGANVRNPSLNEYLYEGLDSTFPILADGAALGDRLRAAQGRVLAALTSRA